MSYYAFTAFFNFLMSIIIGSFVLSRNKKNITNITFFIFAFFVAFWSLAYCFWQISISADVALFFCRVLMAGAIFIPVSYLHFTLNFLSLKNNKFIIFSYILFFVFFILNFTPLFISHVEPFLGFNYWPIAGPAFSIFLIFWFFYVCYTSFLLFRAIKNTVGTQRQQIKLVLIGMILGFAGGSTNFFMWYGIPIPPILNIFVSAYVAMTAYSIVRFRSFDIKLIGAQVLVWALVILIGLQFIFVNENTNNMLIITTLIMSSGIGLLLVRAVKREVFLRESLEEANAGQTNLIHIMNHQIKGYLSINKNIFAELLTEDYGKIPVSAKEIISKGLDNSNKGVVYVTDILRGASAENGTLSYDMRKIDIKNIVLDEIENQKKVIDKKKLELYVDIKEGDYKMIGDKSQLGEAFRNIIENSLYYTIKGSLYISLKKISQKIIFSIKDTGVGIRQDDKDKIFKAGGITKDSIKINVNSSGYGLAFVKGVVERHKGRVYFESPGYNKGSTFYIELPIK